MSEKRIELFEGVLLAMFQKVEPAFRAQTIQQFRDMADRQLHAWKEKITRPWPDESELNWRQKENLRQQHRPGTYVKRTKDPEQDSQLLNERDNAKWWELVKQIKVKVDYKLAEADANALVNNAKNQFVHKQARKLDNACTRHQDTPKVEGQLKLGGTITGYLNVEMPNGDKFVLNMTIIVNSRHNHYKNSYTYFNQFPSRFANVLKDGKPVKNPSEKWMSENF